ALKPPKQTKAERQQQLQAAPSYAELPPASNAGSLPQSPGDMYGSLEPPPRRVVLAPMSTSEEREQAIATVNQRPEAALRVTKSWLRA
ncbi:MAG: hypothetical protein ABJB66_20990, partial [Gemmatimonadaceae bacterium]